MKAGSNEPPDKPSRPQPDPQGDGNASDDKPGTGDRPKSCGYTAGVLGADSNVGPICCLGVCARLAATIVGLQASGLEFYCPISAVPDTTRLQT